MSESSRTVTSLQAAALGSSGGVLAGFSVSGSLGVALPCASAKRSRLFPEVFDECLSVGRGLSLLVKAPTSGK